MTALLPRRLVLCLLAAGFGWPPAIASEGPLPDRTPPAGFTSVNGAAGGRTLAGTFSGNPRSAAAALGGMLCLLGGYFDGAPAVSAAVGDPADRGIMAFFERHPTAPPTGVGQAAYLFARSRIGGRPHYHFALVNTAPIDPGSWTYYYSTVGAPDGVFQRDFALMLDVWRSWSVNQQMLRDRMQDAATTMRQTGEILRSAARGQSEAFDRANRGFSYYLRGLEVLDHTPSGARGSFDRDYADAVVRADPTKFRLVPPSQYRSGD